MDNIKKILTMTSLLIAAMVVFTACDPGEDSDMYDAEAINKHLETDVSFDELYRPQYHYKD